MLFASGQLQDIAQDWCESYQYGCPNNVGQVTWKEFSESFRSYHIPLGVVELKQDEFLNLKQGSCQCVSIVMGSLNCYAIL